MLLQRELGIGFVLIISSSIRDSILLGELVLMSFLLIVAVFYILNEEFCRCWSTPSFLDCSYHKSFFVYLWIEER